MQHGIEELESMKERLVGRYTDRDAKFDKLWKLWDLTRFEIEQEGDLFLLVNKVYQIVVDNVAFTGMPDVRVIPPETSHEGNALADKTEKIIYGVWDYNKMDWLIPLIVFRMSLLGLGVIKLWPDLKNKRVRLIAAPSRNFYPQPSVSEPWLFDYIFQRNLVQPSQFKALFGEDPQQTGNREEYWEYYDARDYCVLWNHKKIHSLRHNLNFTPWVAFPNTLVPGRVEGKSEDRKSVV